MRNGCLFFLNMGRITTGARIAILPLIYLTFFQVRPFGVAYFTCMVLLVLSVLLSMVPAPSDRTAKRTIDRFRYEHKEEMMDRCGFANDSELLLLYGYAEDTKMWMKRALGREMVYPYPVAIGFAFHLNRGRLLIGKRSLLRPKPAEYCFLKDEELSGISYEMHIETDNEEVARLTLRHAALPEELTIYVKNDFCVRELVESLEKAKKI